MNIQISFAMYAELPYTGKYFGGKYDKNYFFYHLVSDGVNIFWLPVSSVAFRKIYK